MPLYEYACPDCGATFDRLRKHAEREDPTPCPTCRGAARPVFSTAAVRASGDGGLPHPNAAGPSGGSCCGGGCGCHG